MVRRPIEEPTSEGERPVKERVKDYISRELFREPNHGWGPWTVLLVGCVALLAFFYSVFFLWPGQPSQPLGLASGLGLVLLGASELLPRNWTALAALLRVGCLVVLLATLVLVVIPEAMSG